MRTFFRLLGASAVVALTASACTNDYEDFEFDGTGGGSSGTGGATTGGSGGAGGATTGGAGGSGGTGGATTGGTGGAACTGNDKLCNGQCVATNDPKYGCGPTACDPCLLPNASTQCVSDKCTLQTCTKGYDSCDANPGNGCEQKLDTTDHCGDCARKCSTQNSTSAACADGSCRHGCAAGYGDCSHPTSGPDNGCETNLGTTKNQCGACGNNCGSQGASGGFGCKAGACGCSENSQCLTTGGLAASSCDVTTGQCVCDGATCNAGEACGKNGPNTVCECNGNSACTAGEICCPGGTGCVETSKDAKNCGGCKIACAAGKTCNAGKCQ